MSTSAYQRMGAVNHVPQTQPAATVSVPPSKPQPTSASDELPFQKAWFMQEAWMTCWWGFLCFGICFPLSYLNAWTEPLPLGWKANPLEAFVWQSGVAFTVMCILVILMMIPGFMYIVVQKKWIKARGESLLMELLAATLFITLMGMVSIWLGVQEDVHSYGLGNEFWALVIGLCIANIPPAFGFDDLPDFLILGGKAGETLIKVGLIVIGIDLQTLGELGAPGIVVALPVTITVCCIGWAFGRWFMPHEQKKFAMMMAAGTAVCGSSAATAIQTTIGGTSSDLTLVIAVLSVFTIIQMVATPFIALAIGMEEAVIAAGLGGTINSTGSVVAAASFLGDQECIDIAATVKIIQNAFIGVVAVLVALYWSRVEDPIDEKMHADEVGTRVKTAIEQPAWYQTFWIKFPKFVVGFLAISFMLTIFRMIDEPAEVELKVLMEKVSRWWFTMGFVGIGLATRFKVMYKKLKGPSENLPPDERESAFTIIMRPIWIYLFAQMVNVLLTFAVAIGMFSSYDSCTVY